MYDFLYKTEDVTYRGRCMWSTLNDNLFFKQVIGNITWILTLIFLLLLSSIIANVFETL
jgi:hypothetical protein